MTRLEKRSVVVGIIVGAFLAALATGGILLRLQRPQPPSAATMPAVPAVTEASSDAVVQPDAARQNAAQLSPEEQARIGLQVSEVRRESVAEDIAAIGRVEEPETALATISTRFGGRIERLFINFTGQPVQKGDPVAVIAITGQPAGKDDPVSSIYSRELIAAAEEYKFALQNLEHARALARPDAIAQADALVKASRVRLERFGLAQDQIDRFLASPEQPIRITVSADVSGIVRSRKVVEGQFVNPGDPLIELTDLRTVWVKADVFDSDIARIRPGLQGTITSEALPGLKLAGVVGFIESRSDPQTRTTPVRLQVNNPGARLKPGMVVQTSFRISLGSVLTVPREAVIDSGTEKVVYIARDNGVFEQQRIQTGASLTDRYTITAGLAAGDKVVSNGVFLVDSQTRLTGGMTGLFGGSKSFADSAPAPNRGAYKVTYRFEPDPPVGGRENTIHVALTDAAGKPVSDAQVRLTFVMPAMPAMNMAELRNSTDLKWTGSDYAGPVQILTAGSWNVAIEAHRGGELLTTVQAHVNAR